ncbi:hypothetical protein J7382_06710 [Shimia sp. R11_0]|uniref:hypothetical protein n=1 Tax=Shimia sp. R11_0 TaxID=2821096 RepID=UPI001ADCBB9E|nr:hypothetical protein [Shimia sp. R11_0]MBO9477219.1 hypothetical protein [Shimia sp. R11_0]
MTQNTNSNERYKSQKVIWQNIGIEVRYCPNWSIVDEGFGFAHLEIISDDRQNLPITETGYKSHFLPAEEIIKFGGAVGYALAWLNEASNSRSWNEYVEEQRQGCLF